MHSYTGLVFGGSEVRHIILRRFFSQPGLTRHVRELARELDRAPAVVGRELERLQRAGILRSENIGRARRYRVDEESPIAAEVRSLVQKTIGVEATVRRALEGLVGIEQAFLFGSYARGDERATSDLDLMVIGAIDQELLSDRLTEVERSLDRDVNVVTYSREEFERLRQSKDLFVTNVMSGPRIELVGREGG